jgi:hypothetical protein
VRFLRSWSALHWLGLVLAVGVVLRLIFLYTYRPAFYGFPDSSVYLTDAAINPFQNGSRPAGYGRFIASLHAVWPRMVLIPLVQHLLGLATGVIWFLIVRRLGAPAGVGVVAAAVVVLGGGQLFIEHAVMAETVFSLCLAVALLAAVEAGRATRPPIALGWAALAGLAIAAATTFRLPALLIAPILAAWLLFAGPGQLRRHLLATAAFAVVAGGGMLAYMAWYESGTGRFAFTRTGFYNSYARVATFADCEKFTPPNGTAKLCPRVPVEDRQGHEHWIFSNESPAWQAYGDSFAGDPPAEAAGEVSRFVRAAIIHQPLDYLVQVGRDSWRLINPQAPSTIGRGNASAGYSQQGMIDAEFDPTWQLNAGVQMVQSGFYAQQTLAVTDHGTGLLRAWERIARFTGPLMLLTLVFAVAAPFVCRALRGPAVLLTTIGLVLLMTPILSSMYDARYVIPALAPLGAAAALGATGVRSRIHARRVTA